MVHLTAVISVSLALILAHCQTPNLHCAVVRVA